MTLKLQDSDYHNLGFLCKFNHKINKIISKYSQLAISFVDMSLHRLQKVSQLTCHFVVDLDQHKVLLDESKLSPEELYIVRFIQHHELIQICMHIYNDFVKDSTQRKWYPLKNTYAIL